MEGGKDSTIFRVLMFPWLAHGHISPYFELSKKLAKKHFKIYFCSTFINLDFIKKNFDENLSDHCIELVEFHLPELPELPPQYHTTKNLPPHLLYTLFDAFQMAKPNFNNIINHLNPDLIIYDSFQPWVPTLAVWSNIPCVHFVTTGAAEMSLYFHRVNYGFGSRSFPFSAIFQTDYERKRMQAMVESLKEKGVEEGSARSFKLSSEFVLIKTSREIEEKYLDYLSSLSGKKMVTVGPLVQESNHNENNDHVDIIEFLNKKDQSSVVFVSFGSEYFLSKEEREAVAMGLELSDVNFIWVIRFPPDNKNSVEEALPEGFLERVKERGMVVDGWAPQTKILEHSSTGGFVSHCGWSSTMETLYHGVPSIAMPIHFDQPTNARLLVEIGVGLEVMRDENGNIKREEVAKVIKMVVLDKTGEALREKSREMSKKLRTKGKEELHEALQELRNLCSRNMQQKQMLKAS